MAKLTVNQLLVLMKEVRSRMYDMKQIRTSSANKERTFFGLSQENRKEIEPQYDVRLIDKRIALLENWLFKVDSTIKQCNATTIVDLDVDVDDLLKPIE